jgi:polysaccharide deacetylase family protein (PEP-CTERM system associated)
MIAPSEPRSALHSARPDPGPLLNAFTVDVEDYYQVSAFERHIDRGSWHEYESRVAPNTRRILRLLDEHNVRGTFFILGWVAEKHPELVAEIDRRGHEIASHSYWHRLVYQQTPEEFRRDLRQSRDVLEQIIGRPVTAFRAPSFSITRRSLWALEILVEEGFRVDSSIYPVYHDRYGIPDARPHIHRLETAAGPLWEFPPAVRRVGRWNLPVSGGGYFRLYPRAWTQRCIEHINRAGRPFMFYIHPWEVDPDQPRLRVGSRVARFRHYLNLAGAEGKLNRLLGSVRFGGLQHVVEMYGGPALQAA